MNHLRAWRHAWLHWRFRRAMGKRTDLPEVWAAVVVRDLRAAGYEELT